MLKREWVVIFSVVLLVSCVLLCATDNSDADNSENLESITVHIGTFLDPKNLSNLTVTSVTDEGNKTTVEKKDLKWSEVGTSEQAIVTVELNCKDKEFTLSGEGINTVYCKLIEVNNTKKLMFWITDWKYDEKQEYTSGGNVIEINSGAVSIKKNVGKLSINSKFIPITSDGTSAKPVEMTP